VLNYSEKFLKQRSNILNSRRGEVRMNKTVLTPPRKLQIEIIKEINESALYLFQYYVSVITNPIIDLLDDKRVAKTIGWTARKVKDTRLKLQRKEFIYFHHVVKDNCSYNTWVITREEVRIFKEYNNTPIHAKPITITQTHNETVVQIEKHESNVLKPIKQCDHVFELIDDNAEVCILCGEINE